MYEPLIFRIKAWLFSHIFLKNIVYFFQQTKIYYFFIFAFAFEKKILFRIFFLSFFERYIVEKVYRNLIDILFMFLN